MEDNHQKENKGYFRLHVDEHPTHHQINLNTPENKVAPTPEKVESEAPKSEPVPKNEKTVKSIFRNFARQIIASAVFLIVGFFILNWSAYSQIALLKWQQFWGLNENTPLTELIEENPVVLNEELLEVSSDPEIQRRQIPDLNLEVTPLDDRIIIPRINQNIPIVRVSSESLIKRDWGALESEMQAALQEGVVHYPGTSLPGQTGNVVITGHSSYFPWDPGRFKDVFALLHDVVVGDKIVVYYKQTKFTYEISETEVVLPEDIDVLKQTPSDKLTLITCTPVGTNLKRLIVSAKPIAINDRPIIETTKVSR